MASIHDLGDSLLTIAPPPTSDTSDMVPLPTANNVEESDYSSSESCTSTSHRKGPSKARAKKARKIQQRILSKSQPRRGPLRPAKDILSRIRHDPALDDADFIVGYHDRHLDVMEISVTSWTGGSDVTEEEFIPQHRILYFRRKGDGIKVWDRKERIDLLFGSGLGDGTKSGGKMDNSGGKEDGKKVPEATTENEPQVGEMKREKEGDARSDEYEDSTDTENADADKVGLKGRPSNGDGDGDVGGSRHPSPWTIQFEIRKNPRRHALSSLWYFRDLHPGTGTHSEKWDRYITSTSLRLL